MAGEKLPRPLRGLLEPVAWPHGLRDPQVIETHISWVILTGDIAYKIKKPVKLGFLDFSTLERRRHYCEEELRINRRTAPELYLGVVPIGMLHGRPRVGVEPAIEYAVSMRQFPHSARLDRCVQEGRLARGDLHILAETLAGFHQSLPPRSPVDEAFEIERVVKPARNNFLHLDAAAFDEAAKRSLAAIEAWTERQSRLLEPEFASRARAGFVRECHGDLHLENLLWLDGRFIAFDALEFSANLRWIDLANDIAFLAMDLAARRRDDLAWTVLSAWLEQTGDYGSLAVLRFYLVYRAMVRAVVAGIRHRQSGRRDGPRGLGRKSDRQDMTPDAGLVSSARPTASRYVELAAQWVDPPPPRLFLMHGFSGSGKTWRSERLVAELPALRVRSDLERKRLAGLDPGQRQREPLGGGLYGPELSDATYRVLLRYCEAGLRAGCDMIADATFLSRRHREWFIDSARTLGRDVFIVDCSAPVEELRRRIARRAGQTGEASDADEAVLDYQLANHDPLTAAEGLLLWPEVAPKRG